MHPNITISPIRATSLAAALFGVVFGVLPAYPQGDAKPPASKVPAEPGMTTASYGDWLLRCQLSAAAKPTRICEVVQTIQVQGQSAPFAQVAMGRAASGDALHAVVVVPINVSFPSQVRVSATEKDTQGQVLNWRRCVPGGCVAEAAVGDDALQKWRGASAPGRIGFVDAAGRNIVVPLSFRGLAEALDALAKEPAAARQGK